MRIGFFAQRDPFTDRREWSGTKFMARQALQRAGFEVKWIPFSPSRLRWTMLNLGQRLLHGPHYKVRQTRAYGRLCAAGVDRAALEGCDCYFFAGGGEMVPWLGLDKPTVYLVDGTFRQMCGYYYGHLGPRGIREGEIKSAESFRACSLMVAASEWTAGSLIGDYGLDPAKVVTAPFGPNIDAADIVSPSRPDWEPGMPLRILFSGVDWRRKGGDVAVETVRLLRLRGFDARLEIVGPRKAPDGIAGVDFVDFKGFLNKNRPADYAEYLRLLRESHLLLLPTRAECAGIVFCEAAAFGLPSFTYDTGGVGTYVLDGRTGRRFPAGAPASVFADGIADALAGGALAAMGSEALAYSRKRLNWDAFGRTVAEAISRL